MKKTKIPLPVNEKLDAEPGTTTQNKIITDQHGVSAAGFSLGKYSVSYNGCEAIAVHNALILSGVGSRLSDVIGLIERKHHLWFFRSGLWGTNPFRIGRIVRSYGLDCIRLKRHETPEKPGIYIVSYFNRGRISSGVHTVCFTFDGSSYTAYNSPPDSEHVHPYGYAFRRICCYRIIKENGCLSKL